MSKECYECYSCGALVEFEEGEDSRCSCEIEDELQ